MAAIVAQNPLVTFRLPCGKVSRDSPLNMAKIGIASAKRDQSPIRSRSSHWRKSPLKPMLSRDLTKLLAGRGAPSLSAGLMRCYLIWLTLVTTAPGNIFMTSRRA